jgi:uncharacterized membrane protein YoaK (UPF0700 family)
MNDPWPQVGEGATPGSNLRRRWTPEAIRDLLTVVLTVVTGATDAIGFVALGGVFTSVMTGNLVLLGVSSGRRDGSLALHAGIAFAGYVAGTWVGARVAGQPTSDQPVWPRPVTVALVIELFLMLGFGVWWELAGGHPLGHSTYALIAVNAVALGVQSGAMLRLGVPGLSTTYLTGMLTQVVSSLTSRRTAVSVRSVAILLAVLGGAGIGAVLAVEAPRAAPAALLVPLAAVLAGAKFGCGGSSGGPAADDSASSGPG